MGKLLVREQLAQNLNAIGTGNEPTSQNMIGNASNVKELPELRPSPRAPGRSARVAVGAKPLRTIGAYGQYGRECRPQEKLKQRALPQALQRNGSGLRRVLPRRCRILFEGCWSESGHWAMAYAVERRAGVEQRDEGRAGTVGGIKFATF